METKMHDMGQKNLALPESKVKNRKWYPSINIDNADFLNNKKIGTKVDLHIRGEIKEVSKDEQGINCRIEMKKYSLIEEDIGDNGGTEMERRFERARRRGMKRMDEPKE